ncbi:TonB family protein, partial [candidate division KSB1 bacterium]|nr:TonB family protein [candidate division KSB1 bacterium]
QTFVNPFDKRIEAVYVFPLPENAAVDRMQMKIGDRTIKGVIKRRAEARNIYEQARKEGKTASLLEQERPNIFTQSVANILPQDTILVEISYVEVLQYEKGQYEFVFPMIVGPRYIPGEPKTESGGTGWAPDTDRVPDASRITPQVLKPGQRTGHDISVKVHLNAGVPVQNLTCKSHPVLIDKIGETEMTVQLEDKEVLPNKDFILNYDVLGPKLETALLTHRADGAGYFLLILQPKMNYDRQEIRPKEMVFVVDNSGSMRGEPIAKAKEAMRHCIQNMNPKDLFQIIKFSEAASSFSDHPLMNTPANRQKGVHFINDMHGSGGTRMIEGIKAALGYPTDPERLRIVLFMTDGYIGNEREIFMEIDNLLGESRLFSFGVGSSVNRFLLDRMALIGQGAVQYVTLDENTDQAVTKFYKRIANPFLTDISIDWGKADVEEMYPSRLPDLFSSQPVAVFGRFENSGNFQITLKGKIGEKAVEVPIEIRLPEEESQNDVIKTLWARHKIKDLKLTDLTRSKETIEDITEIALTYNLMTEYTSFVAVEEQVRTDETGEPQTVTVPIPMPEGVSYEGVFGESAVPSSLQLGSAGAVQMFRKSAAPMQSISVNGREDKGSTSAFVPYDQPPKPVGGFDAIQKALVYPERDLLAGRQGRVIVQVTVEPSGKVSKTSILSSANPSLDAAAIKAIKFVKWNPAQQRGRAVRTSVSVPVVFRTPGSLEEEQIANRTFVKRGEFWVENSYAGEDFVTLRENSGTLQALMKKHEMVDQIIETFGSNVVFEMNGMWYKVGDE